MNEAYTEQEENLDAGEPRALHLGSLPEFFEQFLSKVYSRNIAGEATDGSKNRLIDPSQRTPHQHASDSDPPNTPNKPSSHRPSHPRRRSHTE